MNAAVIVWKVVKHELTCPQCGWESRRATETPWQVIQLKRSGKHNLLVLSKRNE